VIEISDFSNLIEHAYFEAIFIIFARVSAITFLLPGVSASYIQMQYKLAFTFVICFAIFPLVADPVATQSTSGVGNWKTIFGETFHGVLIGITLRMGVFSLQIAGTIIAQSSSIAQIFGGSVSNESQPTVSNILTISGITLLMVSGFLDHLTVYVFRSYEWQSIGSGISAAQALSLIIRSVSAGYSLAFQLALPFVALSLFYNITLGAINRAMPQLLVSFVGAPAIIAASIGLLIISLRPMLETWLEGAFSISQIFGVP
jgi:flagellar biosynthetic protein FliR